MRHAFATIGIALLFVSTGCGSEDPPDLLGDGGAADLGSRPDAPASDAAARDATTSDASGIDAATRDAAPADGGGERDGGERDAGAVDMGPPGEDAGPTDASFPDGGASDGGPGDGGAGDAGAGPICNPSFAQPPPACGGNPAGSWGFREGCGTTVLQTQLTAQCPGATVSNVVRTATGTLDLQRGIYTLRLRDAAAADVNIPAICALAVGGCANIPALFAQAGAMGTCTALSTGACDCRVQAETTRMEMGSFTQSGATLTAGASTYDHCVTGRTLEIQERQSGSVYVLAR